MSSRLNALSGGREKATTAVSPSRVTLTSAMRALHVHRDVLRLEVLADALEAALAAEARLLDTAEGRGGVRDDSLGEPDHPPFDGLADRERAAQVACGDGRAQPQ